MRVVVLVLALSVLMPAAPAAAAERTTKGPVEIVLKDHNRLFRASLIDLTEHDVEIERYGRREVLRLDDIVRIDRTDDSLGNGALIGAIVLGGWCALVCGQGLDSDASGGGVVVAIAALGAVLGAGIDALRYDHSPVYPPRRDAGLGAARGRTVAVAFRLSF